MVSLYCKCHDDIVIWSNNPDNIWFNKCPYQFIFWLVTLPLHLILSIPYVICLIIGWPCWAWIRCGGGPSPDPSHYTSVHMQYWPISAVGHVTCFTMPYAVSIESYRVITGRIPEAITEV